MTRTNMVSIRNYFTIMTMMGVIVFLFLFVGVGKERLNNYDTNPDWEDRTTQYTQAQSWKGQDGRTPLDFEEGDYVLFVTGQEEGPLHSIVTQWCQYTKRNLLTTAGIPSPEQAGERRPEVMLVDSAALTQASGVSELLALADAGVPMIFCDLPETALLEKSVSLRKLLGIRELREEAELTGVHLYEGFLLGGESIYEVETPKDEYRQDLELLVPWCVGASGTKVYMTGLMQDEEIENEELPMLIWRAAYKDAKIFVVNGDYMSGLTGLGFLSAMMKELNSYLIYPVVNAQNFVTAGYPVLASENRENMQKIYTRDQLAVVRDIVGPGLVSVAEHSDYRISAMMAGQMDFSDENLPSKDTLIYYLKQVNEGYGEMGVSFPRADGTSLMEAAAWMDAFLKDTGLTRSYSSLYLSREDAADARQVKQITELLSQYDSYDGLCTVICDYGQTEPVLSYVNENITLQGGVLDGYSHTFSQDLCLKSLETALGYSSIVLNLERVFWPGEEEVHWEVLYDDFSSNINTYWKPFQTFDATTLTESDERVRRFLALDYQDTCQENRISLEIENWEKEAWFLLRTNHKVLTSLQGGEFVELEEHVWLIRALRSQLILELKPELELYYYGG
ncbi:MAG: DUF2194 domain-containing protein [Roseburia sp.]|nr:DUF2194 domain-containing protein [Roseburia sp.]